MMRTVLVRVEGSGPAPDKTVWQHPRVFGYDPAPHAAGPEVEYMLDYTSGGWTEREAELDARSIMQVHGFKVLATAIRGWGPMDEVCGVIPPFEFW